MFYSVHKKILELELDESDSAFPVIIEFTKTYLTKIASTLGTMVSKKDQIEELGCDDLLTSLLSIMRLYLVAKPEEFKFEDVIAFQNHILLPLLAINDNERYTFEESPSDFNTLAEDCCDKQTFEILKTEAAKLM